VIYDAISVPRVVPHFNDHERENSRLSFAELRNERIKIPAAANIGVVKAIKSAEFRR
jgi:hypothetical protein